MYATFASNAIGRCTAGYIDRMRGSVKSRLHTLRIQPLSLPNSFLYLKAAADVAAPNPLPSCANVLKVPNATAHIIVVDKHGIVHQLTHNLHCHF
jgi:hypothetical protein